MRFGGLQPVSLLDYPRQISAIVFALGCNLRCGFCYNPNLVWPRLFAQNKNLAQAEVLAFLRRRQKHLDGLVITGGEPTLQADLPDFCRQVKALGYKIKLDTNGLRPIMLARLIKEKLIDYIAMDIKGPLGQYRKFAGRPADKKILRQSIDLIKKSGLPYEFRSTLVKGLHTEKDIAAMARAASSAEKYFLQNFTAPGPLVSSDFKGAPFTAKEMAGWRELAGQWVKSCKTR